MSSIRRIYVEKKDAFAVEAHGLLADLRNNLGMGALKNIRIINRYDVMGLSDEEFAKKAEEYATNKGYESVDKMYECIKKEDLKNYLEQAKVLDFIGESATIVEKK